MTAQAPAASSDAVRAVMRANGAESSVERALHRRGMRFRKHVAPVPGLRCRPDVVFTAARVVVFVDGCFWPVCPEHHRPARRNSEWWISKLEANVRRDRAHDLALELAGWVVVRVWEHETMESAADRVEAVVRSKRDAARAEPEGNPDGVPPPRAVRLPR